MVLVKAHNRWVIAATYLFALLLCIFPLVYEARWLRPEFLALFVIYWVSVMPQQVSMVVIFLAGCLQSLLEGVLLGQHALALVVVAYFVLSVQQRMQHYATWQQSFVVLLLVCLHQLVDNWIHSFQGGAAQGFEFLMPAFTSALIWPLVVLGLGRVRYRFRIA